MNYFILSALIGSALFFGANPNSHAITNPIETEVETNSDELSDRQLNRLMRSVSDNYENDTLSEPFVARAYYMEKARCEESWCMFTEGEGYLRSFGYDAPVEVQNAIFVPSVIYKSDRTEAWKENMDGYRNTFPKYDYFSDTQTGFPSLTSCFRFFELNGPLMQPRRHSFSVSSSEYQPEESSMLSIDFITDSSRGPSYEGRMLVDVESERVHHISLSKVPFHSVNFFRWLNAQSEISISYVNERAFVSEMSVMIDRRGVDYTISTRFSEPVLYTEEFTESEYFLIQAQMVNPWISEVGSLDHFESYFINDMTQIRSDLEFEKTLEQQFVDNSNQPWRYNLDSAGEVHLGHGGEPTFENARKVYKKLSSFME
ncbi:MAG: hypothetical protein LAT84_06090 [Balneolia bacterium]|nr:hypothetical protein [Balneolia bacterium]